jgi:hypothetical protein
MFLSWTKLGCGEPGNVGIFSETVSVRSNNFMKTNAQTS